MIEFKAECGHTVRARGEDAGQVVRCSYCGRSAKVPEDGERDLDALFGELQADAGTTGGVLPPPRRRRKSWLGARAAGDFNPFPVILKLIYLAVLMVAVVLVYQKALKPLFSDEGRGARAAKKRDDAAGKRSVDDDRKARRAGGLASGAGGAGLLVKSTPSGATIIICEASSAPSKGRIDRVKGCQQFVAEESGATPNLNEGTYIVEVAFPYNDPRLKIYRGYEEFRRQVDQASDAQRREIVENYFIPDEASDAFVEQAEGIKYLVRQYRNVEIRQGHARAVRALFLPRLRAGEGPRFSMEQLVVNHLASERKVYTFDENHVIGELAYEGVPESDRRWVMDALSRIGAMSYVTSDNRTKLFRIGAHDGVFSATIIREAK